MSQFKFKHRNYGLLSIIFGFLFLSGTIFTFFLFNIVLHEGISIIMNLRNGSYERRVYTNPPFPLTHKIFVFHVMNIDEVQNGEKPHLKEIGPFAFDEVLWKDNIIDDVVDDTIEFDYMKKYVFRPDMSNGLTGNEVITTIHPVLVGIGMTVQIEFREYMNVAVAAIREIFHEPTSIFWTGRVMDLLFDGIEIDCNTKDPLAKLACNEIRKRKDPSFKPAGNKTLLFSIFGGSNDTSNGRWKMYRGQKNISNTGQVIEFNGKSEMTIWSGEECNRIEGTDGILITPFRKKDERLAFFSNQVCASLHLKYKRRASFRGIDLHVFTYEFDDITANNKTCFCRQPNQCPLKGTMDIMRCVGAPVTVSLPHFLHADPSLLANIASGLNPIEEKHEFTFSIELDSGIDVVPVGRVQINFELEPVTEIKVMSKLRKMLFPLLWFQQTADIPDFLTNWLKYLVALAKKMNTFGKWITMTIFLFGTVICSTLYILKRFSNVNIFEEEKVFGKTLSSNSKVAPKIDNDIIVESEEKESNDVATANTMLFLSDVVTQATAAANKNKLQNAK